MRIWCRGGVKEAQQAQLVDRRSSQLLPQLTSDPADSAQLFQAFSSTLPPSPCTPVATCQPPSKPPYLHPHSLIYKQVLL